MSSSHIPQGYHTINPYLTVDGAARLIEFLKAAFDAREVMRMDGPDGRVAHAAYTIGDSIVETSDSTAQWGAMRAAIHIYMPDTDETYRRALAAGAKSLREPADMFYGERGASVEDPVGNMWHIATKTEDLSVEEMNRRAAEMGAQGGGA